MISISLGPLALPVAPLLLLLAALLASWVADRQAASAIPAATMPGRTAGARLTDAVLIGLVLARAVHVAVHRDAYFADPWTLVDIRDGGWNASAGLIGGLAWASWQAWRHPPWRRALAGGTAAGLLVWTAGTAGLAASAPRDLPDVTLTDLTTGQPVRLRERAAGSPTVVNLWATWCAPCRREMPVLAAAQVQHPNAVFIFANQGEDAETVRRYLAAERLQLEGVLLDTRGQLGPALRSGGLPTTVFFDRTGRRVDAHMGALNAASLSSKLTGALKP
jgi:thiol-disulfide isomerase/thioredoxin